MAAQDKIGTKKAVGIVFALAMMFLVGFLLGMIADFYTIREESYAKCSAALRTEHVARKEAEGFAKKLLHEYVELGKAYAECVDDIEPCPVSLPKVSRFSGVNGGGSM